ncbi:hypothetical protein [uncultured Campylobacter sp.]|uniref:hypothetical protein n=1 Tax=uncultured Campylobacter sp. TaxID=218934 RepID=UPI0025F0E4FC|nr:hypothetical protein [uncultured Campylobacter sp.]
MTDALPQTFIKLFNTVLAASVVQLPAQKTRAPMIRARIGYNPKPNFTLVRLRQAEPP